MAQRKKRSKEIRAYNKGFLAGSRGHSEDICPHNILNVKMAWRSGWCKGREEFLTGYVDQSTNSTGF